MDNTDFKIWLIKNDHTQATLAVKLEITPRTITNYKKLNKFPRLFELALKGIESEAEQ